MGEDKRRREQKTPLQLELERVSREFADRGQLIEAGWLALRVIWLHPDSPPQQIKDLRWAFMAGAHHLLASISAIMDDDDEPTEADLRRMDLISHELMTFYETEVRSIVGEPPPKMDA